VDNGAAPLGALAALGRLTVNLGHRCLTMFPANFHAAGETLATGTATYLRRAIFLRCRERRWIAAPRFVLLLGRT
jgi:hypothetical protein